MRYISIILRILAALLVQILVFSNLQFSGWCYPFVYIISLLCLPAMPRWAEMLTGFFVGLIIDICLSSLGIHAAACTLISYLRPIFLSHSVQDYERVVDEVNVETIGLAPFIKISVVLCLLHHGVVFFLDSWDMQMLVPITVKWLLSSVVTLFFIMVYGIRKSL